MGMNNIQQQESSGPVLHRRKSFENGPKSKTFDKSFENGPKSKTFGKQEHDATLSQVTKAVDPTPSKVLKKIDMGAPVKAKVMRCDHLGVPLESLNTGVSNFDDMMEAMMQRCEQMRAAKAEDEEDYS